MPTVDLAKSSLRELNQALHDIKQGSNETSWEVVNPKGSQRFAQLTPVGVVEVHCFEHFYHEIFNETHRKHVVNMLIDWLNQRL